MVPKVELFLIDDITGHRGTMSHFSDFRTNQLSRDVSLLSITSEHTVVRPRFFRGRAVQSFELPPLNLIRGEDQMSSKTFSILASIVFLLVAVVHVLRLVFRWEVIVVGWQVPLWISAVAFVIAAFMAYEGFRISKHR